ncbi:DUF488 family protein [Pseudomonas sp. LS1212]|uniref:DUF488 domain-containing protein n=1 Tax=Pseudomonas sp. LS1212 TaxID=2972478 RepID=UPI00215C8A0B|nr:DUF488 family protein [Pseudomonas sp. LS1212]UVJ46192.1 DUF488 family protein [Pseudomonas sp. LS1212]
MIQCKRAYAPASTDDGLRILVDRLWPRNCRKDQLPLHAWNREVAPSTELRRAFKQGELDFDAFRTRYRQELAGRPEHWMSLMDAARKGTLTLIYSAKDTLHNNAQVLAEWLEDELDRENAPSSPVCYANEPHRH